ncbi:hypothetical protein MOP89_10570 [Enterococcus gallinarum]|nr:hypothetical protein [Enterococcus gallinarum]
MLQKCFKDNSHQKYSSMLAIKLDKTAFLKCFSKKEIDKKALFYFSGSPKTPEKTKKFAFLQCESPFFSLLASLYPFLFSLKKIPCKQNT